MKAPSAPTSYEIPAARFRWAAATLQHAGIAYQAQRAGSSYQIVAMDPAAGPLLAPIVAYKRQAKRRPWFRWHYENIMIATALPVIVGLMFGPIGAGIALAAALGLSHLDARRDHATAAHGRWFWVQLLAVLACLVAFVGSMVYAIAMRLP